jgi:hypothetical protein
VGGFSSQRLCPFHRSLSAQAKNFLSDVPAERVDMAQSWLASRLFKRLSCLFLAGTCFSTRPSALFVAGQARQLCRSKPG